MIYKGTSFNMKFVLQFPDAESFAKHPSNHTAAFWTNLTDEERHKRLVDFWNLATNQDGNDQSDAKQSQENKFAESFGTSDGGNGTGSDIGSETAVD